MSDELLTKENKFYELNGELERKAKELTSVVNSVVNTKLRFDSNETLLASDTRLSRLTNHESIIKNRDESSKYTTSKYVPDSAIRDFQSHVNLPRYLNRSKQSFKEETSKVDGNYEGDFEQPVNNSRNDAVVRFFKSKAKMLETELEAMKVEYKKKCDYSIELQSENKKIDEERVRYHGQLTALKETLNKVEANNNAQITSLQRTEMENISLKKELDALKKELKAANQNTSSYNIRLNRSLEENERLRKSLKCSQLDGKELRDENRKLEEGKKAIITNLEKQRTELLHAFKKQILLVDNLKKQKAYLEANMLIKYTEEELLKLLDWKSENV